VKFTQDPLNSGNVINKFEPGCVYINNVPHDQSLLLSIDSIITTWPVTSTVDLTEEVFMDILLAKPEVLLIGTGSSFKFIAPSFYKSLINAQIGVEFMNNASACRTYNVLQSEGRKVLLGLIL